MGTDYAQRKLAKKKWKKFSSETSGDADKKKRSKRQKIRRLCQVPLNQQHENFKPHHLQITVLPILDDNTN